MGTKWGEGKKRLKDPRNIHPKTQILMAEYMKTGSVVKAANKVGVTKGAAKKTLAKMRDYMRQVMGEEGLTLQAVLEQLQFKAWTGKNEMAAVAALKTLADHLRDLSGTEKDDISKMSLPELVELLRGFINDYDHAKVKASQQITDATIVEEAPNGSNGDEPAGAV